MPRGQGRQTMLLLSFFTDYLHYSKLTKFVNSPGKRYNESEI